MELARSSLLVAPRAAAPRRGVNRRIAKVRASNAEGEGDQLKDRPVADDALARIEALLNQSEKAATEKRVASQSVVGLLQQTQNALKDKVCTWGCPEKRP